MTRHRWLPEDRDGTRTCARCGVRRGPWDRPGFGGPIRYWTWPSGMQLRQSTIVRAPECPGRKEAP